MGRRAKRRTGRALVVLLLIATLAAAGYLFLEPTSPPGAVAPPPAAAGVLRIHYVDVGQGDGTIWELPDGSLVLYDCGPPAVDADANPMVRYLRDALSRPAGSTLAALVASHGHLDHVGGCDEILSEYVVEHVYEAWYEGRDAPGSYHRFLDAVRAEGATVHRLPEIAPGVRLEPRAAGATFLWPPAFAPGGWDAIAEASLVLRVQHGATTFCFQGDIEDRQEAQLTARCDVYLAGHHGSRHASSARWLAQMGPRIAVVSHGENAYGHPHPEALCRIEQAGATIYATPGTGAVIVESDGSSVRVVQGEPMAGDPCSAP